MTLPTSQQALSLYRSLHRSARLFNAYNFKQYITRRSRDAFRENQKETDPAKINELLTFGKQQLLVAQRQGAINSLYSHSKLVIE
ncbi:LYR motif-containing protein 4, partial [Ramicandelaber brevisporus]